MFTKLATYFSETKTELKRVVWPSRQDTTKHTLAVIGISVVVAIFLGTLDILFQFLLEIFIL
ncbi:MAG: preprotein translocase subunit SecE [Candidatus Ryanbacteria bacterium RIFCSPHIGHO2_02_FULL_45_17b]|uniref:Protein translocase subunit SecE n=1 Tax=Candidatus Ryanbacteria bacterium RIFCSPHIGHO2_01_FULL_45_22 TaxID=1802114 RepID=A0A1G2G230_9BACT|nr:MAG: preprotein translocase subunit SecE [Candidatus Ryanbacteria bacterium RIFCSPHIGHO2_01_FULL_45_22]OGZ47094.1 MAG: preprotein translocase subunit SecE [Candidatus Ryanbacteria bacterium RIFCSPHIGHO2_02_FULL_45_17b]